MAGDRLSPPDRRDDPPPETQNGKADPSVSGPSASGSSASVPLEEPCAVENGPAREKRRSSSITEGLALVLLALLLAFTLKTYVAEAYEIKGRSMEPTFHSGERVVVLKAFYEIERGDVIIFRSLEDPSKDLIKRVVGLPGDRILVENGRVYVNGKLLEEDYLSRENLLGYYPSEHIAATVGPNEYYVLGDNRRDSHDSRRFHGVPFENVKGKVVVRWWPLDHFRSF